MKDWLRIVFGITLLSAVMTFATYDAYALTDDEVYEDPEASSEGAPYTANERGLVLPIASQCGAFTDTLQRLEVQFNEIVLATGEVRVRNLQTGNIDVGDLYITVNPKEESRDFTLLFVLVDRNIACVIGTGVGLGPYTGDMESVNEEQL